MIRSLLVTAVALLPCAALFSTQDSQDKKRKPVVATVGKAAPSFRLNDHRGRAVDVGGKCDEWIVLAFYPKAGTPG